MDESRLLTLAQSGDIEGLIELIYSDVVSDPSEDPDAVAYKWLTVASDFGHEAADEMIEALLTGPLHADDDSFVSGHAHFELAVSYLTGKDGLPIDFDLGRTHILEMVKRHYPYSVQEGEGMLVEARKVMSAPAQAVFDAALAWSDKREAEWE